MEIVTFSEFLNSWRVLYLIGVIIFLAVVIRWLINEANGSNYYKRYPIAKAMDEMTVSGELKDKTPDDIMNAMTSINLNTDKETQVRQFKESIKG